MGFWDVIFRNDGGGSTKVRQSKEDNSKVRGDKYTPVSGGGHVHQSYDQDKGSGSYREYHGGENSGDRSYNK